MAGIKEVQHGSVVGRAVERTVSAVSRFSGRVLVSSLLAAGATVALHACGDDSPPSLRSEKPATDGGVKTDAGPVVTPTPDAGPVVNPTPDAGPVVTPTPDAGTPVVDAGPTQTPDAGPVVTPTPDAGTPVVDAGTPVEQPNKCLFTETVAYWLRVDDNFSKQPEGSVVSVVSGQVSNNFTVNTGDVTRNSDPSSPDYGKLTVSDSGNAMVLVGQQAWIAGRGVVNGTSYVRVNTQTGAKRVYFQDEAGRVYDNLPLDSVGAQRITVKATGVERTNYDSEVAVGFVASDATGVREKMYVLNEGETVAVRTRGPDGEDRVYNVTNHGMDIASQSTMLVVEAVEGDTGVWFVSVADGQVAAVGSKLFARSAAANDQRPQESGCVSRETDLLENNPVTGNDVAHNAVPEGDLVFLGNGETREVRTVVVSEDGNKGVVVLPKEGLAAGQNDVAELGQAGNQGGSVHSEVDGVVREVFPADVTFVAGSRTVPTPSE